MFDAETLTAVVGLHQKSYRLLRWVGESLRAGTLRFTVLHDALSLPDAAAAWVARGYDSFPPDARPERDQIPAFAHLFASYLQTSFTLRDAPGTRRVSDCGCYCSLCSYLISANNLQVRTPDRKAKERAGRMKDLSLSVLAAEAGIENPRAAIDAVSADPALAEEIAYVAYGRELLRRSEFASQGEGVLALWREIAWDTSGKPRKNFTLTAERILRAEAALRDRLTRAAAAGGA